MALETFSCPECGVKLRRSPHLKPGALVQCPKCRLQFPVPEADQDAAPPPAPDAANPDPGYGESPAPGRGGSKRDIVQAPDRYDDAFDRPARREYDEDYEDQPGGRRGEPGELSSDYKIDLGEWFGIAVKHWGAMLGPFIGFGVLFVLLLPILIFPPFSILVLPHLMAGPYVVALKMLKGEPWTFNDFFGGFKWYGSILGMTFLVGLIQVACVLPVLVAYLVIIIPLLQAGPGGPPPAPGPEALLIIPAYLVTLVAAWFFNVRFYHALPLIIDRNFGAIESMKGSWKLTQGHFWMTFLVAFLCGIINGGGASVCYVGVLFTLPLTILVHAAGYLLIAGTRKPVSPGEGYGASQRRRFDRDY